MTAAITAAETQRESSPTHDDLALLQKRGLSLIHGDIPDDSLVQ